MAFGGCAPGAAGEARPPAAPGVVEPSQPQSVFADDELDRPAYGKAELTRALGAERELVATQDRQLVALEATGIDAEGQLQLARADLGVRRRFVATLEACEAASRLCPPRLDDPAWSYDPERTAAPPLSAPLRFDRSSWRAVAAELHGRACACRTAGCVDSLLGVIDQLEPRPMREVQDDEAATASVTAARQCLFRLRGNVAISATRPPAAE